MKKDWFVKSKKAEQFSEHVIHKEEMQILSLNQLSHSTGIGLRCDDLYASQGIGVGVGDGGWGWGGGNWRSSRRNFSFYPGCCQPTLRQCPPAPPISPNPISPNFKFVKKNGNAASIFVLSQEMGLASVVATRGYIGICTSPPKSVYHKVLCVTS